jgi:hypothetical protein
MTISKLAILIPILFAAGCATTPQWNSSTSSRELAVARVSYEYQRSHEPSLSDAQAAQLAASRCNSWGYSTAEMIPGELRDCSATDGNSCELWKITREYQCKGGGGSFARSAAR